MSIIWQFSFHQANFLAFYRNEGLMGSDFLGEIEIDGLG